MRIFLPILLAVATPAAADPPPRFDPIVFFAGHTEGTGDMKIVMHGIQAMAVHGHGTVDADGTLVLDQVVDRHGQPPREREWRIRPTTPGHYAGTLTDAVGPVAGEAIGDRLHLAYRMKGGLAVEQWLTLAPDGGSARNVMRVRKLGMVVAHLDETIRRAGD